MGFLISFNTTINKLLDKIGEKLLQVKDKSIEAMSVVNKFGKTVAVNIMPNIVLKLAEILPIGGWFKYSFSGMDDLNPFSLCRRSWVRRSSGSNAQGDSSENII